MLGVWERASRHLGPAFRRVGVHYYFGLSSWILTSRRPHRFTSGRRLFGRGESAQERRTALYKSDHDKLGRFREPVWPSGKALGW